jgi:hypothetical protein
VNGLRKSHGAVGKQLSMQYTTDKTLAKKLQNIMSRRQGLNYKGYDQMISAYFEALAQTEGKGEPAQNK